MKKWLACLLCIISAFSFIGCKGGGESSSSSGNGGGEVTEMKEIEYEMTKNKQRTGANVNLMNSLSNSRFSIFVRCDLMSRSHFLKVWISFCS